MLLYHVTSVDALPLIQRQGLVPQIGPRSQQAGECSPATFFFVSRQACEDGLMTWLGDAFDEDVELVILAIEVADELPHRSVAAYECAISVSIPPSCIQRVWQEAEFS